MKIIITVGLFMILPFTFLQAQTDKDGVITAVRDYVDAFYNADTIKIYKSIAKDVVKYGYAIPKNKTRYERFDGSFTEMVSSIIKYGKFPKPTLPKIEVFEVLNQTASAKVSAGWGIDYILLAKQNGNWMITHVLWQTYPSNSK
jgi:Putative lumazine-binding